jgi:nucleoside-diphosphate-sugar epimerase
VPDFWPGRPVMVTGGGGFLGQTIMRRLQAGGADPIFVPRSRDYDLRKKEGIDRAFAEGRPRLTVHAAADSQPRRSLDTSRAWVCLGLRAALRPRRA